MTTSRGTAGILSKLTPDRTEASPATAEDAGILVEPARPASEQVAPVPAPENKTFYPALDGFRAVAVLGVFLHHYFLPGEGPWDWGWAGVDAFFVLSGFLITGILYDTRHAAHRLKNFYGRRVLRIFPLYYGVLLTILIASPWMHWVFHPAVLLWPLYLGNYARFFWLHDWQVQSGLVDQIRSSLHTTAPFHLLIAHFWSLCVEEQFYLIWPFVVFQIRDRARLRNVCLITSAVCLILRIVCVWVVPEPYLHAELLNRVTFLRADALLLGGAVALMLRGPEAPWVVLQARRWIWVFVGGFALWEAVYRWQEHTFYTPLGGGPVLTTIGYTLLDVFAALVILRALDPAGWVYGPLTWRALQRLGQVSYGFYVFHDIPHVVYWHLAYKVAPHLHMSQTGCTALLALLGTLLLAFLSYRLYEAPFLRLKSHFV